MHPGQGPGLSLHDLGETGGSETVTLLESEMPSHSHALNAVGGFNGTNNDPTGGVPAKGDAGLLPYTPTGPTLMMAPEAIAPTGGDQPHNNMMPYVTYYFCIALQGVFPPRG